MLRSIFFVIYLSSTAWTLAAEEITDYLPYSNVKIQNLTHPNKASDLSVQFSEKRFRLIGDFSDLWMQGIHLDKKSKVMTIPRVVVAPRRKIDNGYIWEKQLKHPKMMKMARVTMTSEGVYCHLKWQFKVTLGAKNIIDDAGHLRYRCPAAGKTEKPVAIVADQNKASQDGLPNINELIPEFGFSEEDSSEPALAIQRIFNAEKKSLMSCAYRNFNREGTTKDPNLYSAPPQGAMYYEITFPENKFAIRPYQTANDKHMDSCVIDIVERYQPQQELKKPTRPFKIFLLYDVHCENAPRETDKRYDCKVKLDLVQIEEGSL